MNISKILLLGTFFGIGVSSCVNEEFPTTDAKQGSVSLDVDHLKPSATRAIETADFPVAIYDAEGNKEVASYDKASLVPKQIKMSVGNYYAVAHTPGVMDKIMDKPYYSGRDDFEILPNINTVSTVVCRMANGSFKINFSDDFAGSFTNWTISIDDGTSSAIIYTFAKDGWTPPVTYMAFEEKVEVLNVNFTGITTSGNRIAASNKLTKKAASEQYDSDNPYFSGGDAIEIEFRPVESTEGDITGITLKADIQFEESEEDFEMEVEDNTSAGGDDEGGNEDTPGEGGDSDAIILDLPSDMIVSGETDPSLGDTYIASENGLKSITVKISSTSEEMIGSLALLSENYEGVDFLKGTEVVDNQGLVTLFTEGLGQELSVPSQGDKEYTFPIGNFFNLLAFLPGEHTFTLTITDMNGNTKNGILKLTVE